MPSRSNESHASLPLSSFPPDLIDPVVAHLTDTGVVTNAQVWRAYRKRRLLHQLGVTQPVWRLLATDPSLSRDRVFGVAAEVYDYREVDQKLSDLKAYVRKIVNQFTEAQWRRMRVLGLVPVGQVRRPLGRTSWLFASYDPTQPAVHRVAKDASYGMYELRFAPQNVIDALVTEASIARGDKSSTS